MKFISEGVLVMFFITNSIVNLDLVFSVPSEMLYSERLVLVFKKKKKRYLIVPVLTMPL